MLVIGERARRQPPPPAVVFEALVDPDRDPNRPWLTLLEDEQRPQVLEQQKPDLVVWSSLWTRRPDARLRFELSPTGVETRLRWILLVDEPEPDAATVGHFRRRVNELINANLRYTFGQ